MGPSVTGRHSSLSIGILLVFLAVTVVSLAVPSPMVPVPPKALGGTNTMKPTMGWNSWNTFACSGLTELLVRETADAMNQSGLLSAGYNTLTLDDCWSAASRDSAGNLTNDPVKFPSGMKAIGDYLHARGLRYGIYASIGTATCTGHTAGSLDHEQRDVATFASWGVDYIKADRCDANGLVMKDIYARWRDAIVASGRPIVLSASDNTPVDEPWAWGPITAHQWRMSGDIRDDWASMIDNFDRNFAHAAATAPGTFNDPDMLEVGNGGMTDAEYETHLGLWALMSAPLIAGNDVRNMSNTTLMILTNPEVIAVDQDALGFQAIKASDDGSGLQVWYKPLSTAGARAVGLLNRGNGAATIRVDWSSLGLAPGSATVRDLWARADRGSFSSSYSVRVPGHGLAFLRIKGADQVVSDGFVSDQPWTYMANEAGPVERNSSNGGGGTGDGRVISLSGVTYLKGLGGHAPSAVEFRPNGACSHFTADVGVDDEVGDLGTVIFQVWGDGSKLYETGVMTGANVTERLGVNISGVQSLRLQVVAVDSASNDHADWADARIACTGTPPPPNQRPLAEFTTNARRVRPGESVLFDASASTDPDGTIVSYVWDFGDGSQGNGVTVGHAYPRSGRFVAVLTVTDNNGATNTATAEIVANYPPVAAFSADPLATHIGLPVRFNASTSSDSDGVITSYMWDFGDGQTATGVSPTHSYAANGTFAVALVVTDDLGGSGETSKSMTIGNRAPLIDSASPGPTVVLEAGLNQTFAVSASDPDGDTLTYSWTLDGALVGGDSSSYTLFGSVAGVHVLAVVVSDGSHQVHSMWTVEVRKEVAPPNPAPPAGLILANPPLAAFIVIEIEVLVGICGLGILRRRTR